MAARLMRPAQHMIVSALRAFGPHVPGWFPLIVERLSPRLHLESAQAVKLLGSHMALDIREYMQRRYFFHCYEAHEVALVKRWLRPGDLFVDVGAYVGLFSLLAARLVGPSGRVYAFEPVPATFEQLRSNVLLNRYNWIEINQAAVGEKPGQVALGLPEERLVGYSASDFTVGGNLKKFEATVTTLDGAFGNRERIRLLKIDAEGYEPQVMDGAAALLAGRPPEAIMFEANQKALERSGHSIMDLFERLAEAGYRVRTLGRRGALRPPPSIDALRKAAAASPDEESRSKLRVGLATRHRMFNAIAIHHTA